MKRREVTIGLAAAAAVAGGVLYAKNVHRPIPEGGLTDVAELDISRADGTLTVGGLVVKVTAEPRPLRVFSKLQFRFRFEQEGSPVSVQDSRISFNMKMDMGPHDYRLVARDSGDWVATDVILPQCGSGSRLWFGQLELTAGGKRRRARLRLELAPPDGA